MRAVAELRHDPLEAPVASGPEELGSRADHMLSISNGFGAPAQDRLQPALSLLERLSPQVRPVEVQDVEGEVRHGRPLGKAPQVLEAREARGPVAEDHRDLAVDPGAPDGQLLDRRRDLGEALRPVLAVAAHEPHAALLHSREDPISVVLQLMEPAIARRRAVHEQSELRLDEERQGGTWLAFGRHGVRTA
jgi:hypothetical protein